MAKNVIRDESGSRPTLEYTMDGETISKTKNKEWRMFWVADK